VLRLEFVVWTDSGNFRIYLQLTSKWVC